MRESTYYEILPTLYRSQNHKLMRPLLSLKLSTKEGITASPYRSRNGCNPSPRYEAEYSAAIWEDVLNHKLKDRKDEVKVSALAMLKERCRDPNVLYDAKEWTLHNYQDSVKMGTPLMMCVPKVIRPEPIFFEKLEDMKVHWQSCST